MRIVQIEEDSYEKMSECAEDIMQAAKTLLTHLNESRSHTSEEPYQERNSYGRNMRNSYNDEPDYPDEDERQPVMRVKRGGYRRVGYTRY